MKINITSILFLLFATSLAQANTSTEKIIGTWKNIWPGQGKAVISFKPNGIFSATIYFEDGRIHSGEGTWKVKDDQILYEYKASKGNIKGTDMDRIVSITDDSFVILAQDGRKRKYDKLKK